MRSPVRRWSRSSGASLAASPGTEVASGQSEITLVYPLLSQRLVQQGKHAAPLCDEETPRGITIEPVDQFDPARAGSGRTQTLDDAEIEPAAAVHRPTGRLVQHDQSVVFVQNRAVHGSLLRLGRRLPRPGIHHPHRRNPHDITRSQTVVLSHAAAVDPNFATTQQSVNPRARNAFETERQEVVDTLPGSRLVHGHPIRCFPTRPVCPVHQGIVPVSGVPARPENAPQNRHDWSFGPSEFP